MLFTSLFWKDFLERLVSTIAQVSLGLLTADATAGVSLQVWLVTVGVAALGVFVKCLAANGVGNTVSPASFAPAFPDKPAKDEQTVEAEAEVKAEEEVVVPEPVFEPVEEPVVVEEKPLTKAAPKKRAPRKKKVVDEV